MAWVAFLTLWALWLAGWPVFPWVFLAEIAFLALVLPGGGLPPKYLSKLKHLCSNQAERNTWLALFEKQYPELSALPPLWLHPRPVPWYKTIWAVTTLILSWTPVLYKMVQHGYLVLAMVGIATILLVIATSTPLIRWAGFLVGGRYAAWVAYHFLLEP